VDDLIKEVMKKTGLDENQARAAAEAVILHLKGRLPQPAAGMVAEFLADAPNDEAQRAKAKKARLASIAATTAAINVTVLPPH
jgi:uncharacterized protein (DUF2267 family)